MYTVYTDGSFSQNSTTESNAGWACVINRGYQIEVAYNHGNLETSRSAELNAIEMALHITCNIPYVTIRCDDKWLVSTLSKGNVAKRIGESFTTSGSRNFSADNTRIQKILDLISTRRVDFSWVKGHSNDELNIIADSLAWIARTKPQKRLLKPIQFRYSK
jgi:ribonuclease HI